MYQGGVQGRYEFSPNRDAILEVQGAGINYPTATPSQALPNSTSFAVLAGLDYASSGVWRYRALIGYEQRNYATLSNSTTPVQGANLANRGSHGDLDTD